MPDQKKTKVTSRKPVPSAAKKGPAKAAPARAKPAVAAKRPARPAAAKPAPKPAPKPKVPARPVVKAAAKSAAPGKIAAKPAAAKAAARPAVAKAAVRPAVKVAAKPGVAKPGAVTAALAKASARRGAPAKGTKAGPRPTGPDPEGFFVARVRGEDAVRDAPHPMLEGGDFDEEPAPTPAYDEGLGELPWTYGDDALIALPRDPRTLFLYWDHAQATLSGAFQGLDQPRAQIWLFVRGAGWERIRVVDFALESRGYYLHDLEPGRVYRAEIHVVDRHGHEKLVPHASNPMLLPPHGPSPVVDDRFVAIPWELPLGRLIGAGVPGGPFSEELRALLARLSDWARVLEARGEGGDGAGGGGGGGGAGGMGGRPTSRGGEGAGAGRPSSPSSPFGPFGGEGR